MALVIFAGLRDDLEAMPITFDNFRKIHRYHENVEYRYKIASPTHQGDSNDLNDWLFNPKDGVMLWLGL
ncbi:MAG: hypothetical protein ACE5I1_32085 [bacterium]